MQETLKSNEPLPIVTHRLASSQRDTALQLGLSHVLAASTALGMFFWLNWMHIQQPYLLLISLVIAGGVGLLCTLNFQYSLYLLEITLSHLAHDALTPNDRQDNETGITARRWPLIPLFARLQETTQRLRQYAANELLTTDLREKALQQAAESAAQTERNRIARELHDSIKQQIFSISVSAAAAQAHRQQTDDTDARAAIEDIQRGAREAQIEMQALLQQLRPAPLENTSLVDALRIQAQALGLRTGAQVHVEIGEIAGNERLVPGTPEAIFRLVQEAFTNIARHARAQTIWLTLRPLAQTLRVEVRDDGQGFAPEQVQEGMGLHNLRERARELHGQTEITSTPGQGTSIVITLPLLNALRSPEEEARQKYELARAAELSLQGYQFSENTALLGMALVVLATLLDIHWSVVALGTLVSVYGYIRGIYYRIQVALRNGRESKIFLELKCQQHHTLLNLARLLGFDLWYIFILLGFHNSPEGWWSLAGILILLSVGIQLARRQYFRNTERYYALLSSQELRWELEKRRQAVTRSILFWFIASAFGLAENYALLIPPPVTTARQVAYGIALVLLIMGLGLGSEYLQIQRWRQKLGKRDMNKEAGI